MGASLPLLLVFLMIIFEIYTLPPKNTEILYHRNQRKDDGYYFEYKAEDGTQRQETGTLIYRENETEPVLRIKGMYSYLGADGRQYVVNYEADEKGMKQNGDNIPAQPNNKKQQKIS